MGQFIDLTGQKFGRLTVLGYDGSHPSKGSVFLCQCDCGKVSKVKSTHLRRGATKSCGCLSAEKTTNRNTTHKQSNTRLYFVYRSMLNRCLNEKSNTYSYYGGRGIAVSEKWMSFEGFFEDMGASYKAGLSLERRDVNGGYNSDNCYWATDFIQRRNRTDNVYLTCRGETLIMKDWADRVRISHKLLWWRLRDGWEVDDAIFTPPRKFIKRVPKNM
jgi:hypothetical protein